MSVAGQPAMASPGRIAAFLSFYVIYQGAWLACVLGAANGRSWMGVATAACVVLASIALSSRRSADATLVVAAVGAGLAWDGAMSALGIVRYAEPGMLPAPAWILALWALFAITLREPLRFLHERLWIGALVGAIGGPMSYAAASRMGACTFPDPAVAFVVLASGWGFVTPLLLALARHLDRPSRGAPA